MKNEQKTRVLLLADEFYAAQVNRLGSHPRSTFQVKRAASKEELFGLLGVEEADVVVATIQASGEADAIEVKRHLDANNPTVTLVIVGEDPEESHFAQRLLDTGISEYLSLASVERIPAAIRRAARESSLLTRQHQLESEVRHAHDALLQNQKLTAMGRLAASIAHEINNPLESITNLLYLLRNEPEISEKMKQYVGLAEREMGRVSQISKQTLNFYRETRTPVRSNPAELLDEVLVLYSRRLEERSMQVVRQYKTKASLLVYPGEIRQVLSNLITNAIEASPSGGRLVLRLQEGRKWSDEGVNGVRITIADNGSGISAETRQRLGELFYTTKGQRGTGLGLWVTSAIIRRYGGSLQLYSSTREGRHGTVFSIFIPTNLKPQALVVGSKPSAGQAKPGLAGDTSGPALQSSGPTLRQVQELSRNRSPLAAS